MSSSEVSDAWRSDGATVAGLYAPLRPRHLNPEGYDAKVTFWCAELQSHCRRRRRARLRCADLQTEFTLNDRRPECIHQVVQLMLAREEVVPRAGYSAMCADAGLGWVSWAVDRVLWKPTRSAWGLAKSMLLTPSGHDEVISLAVLKFLSEDLYNKVVADMPSRLGCNLCEADVLFGRYRALFEARSDFDLVLRELVRSNRVAVETVDDRTLVKFRMASDVDRRPTVTVVDRGVLRLTESERSLTKEIEEAELQCQTCKQQVLECLKLKQRSQAMRWLRKQKQLQSRIDKRCQTLDSVQTMLHQMEDSKSDQQVLEAMLVGAEAMKDSSAKMSLDAAEDIIDTVKESLDEQGEIGSVLSQPLGFKDVAVDPGELEQELEHLLDTDKDDGAPRLDVSEELTLPSPPKSSPSRRGDRKTASLVL